MNETFSSQMFFMNLSALICTVCTIANNKCKKSQSLKQMTICFSSFKFTEKIPVTKHVPHVSIT